MGPSLIPKFINTIATQWAKEQYTRKSKRMLMVMNSDSPLSVLIHAPPT